MGPGFWFSSIKLIVVMSEEIIITNKYTGRVANPQVVAAEVERIRKETGAEVTTHILVRYAEENPKSPLRPYMTWDDTAAAHKCRLFEAALLLRMVKVYVKTDEKEPPVAMRAFVNVRLNREEEEEDETQGTYVPLRVALRVDDYRTQMLESAFRELDALKRKYAMLSELSEVFEAVERVRQPRIPVA